MTTTASIFRGALVALALTTGASASMHPQAQRGGDWCDDGRDSWNDDRANFCEVRNFTVPAAGAVLSVDAAPNGGISVEGINRGDIVVVARVNATARTMEEARAIASRVEVVATAERIQANGPENLRNREGWSVSYRIEAPTRTPMTLRSTNGGISVSNINSRLDLRTVNGGVTLRGVGGDVQARTSNGGITVDLEGSTWQGSGLDAETANGGVKVRIPQGYSAQLEASTNNGGINVDFPITVQGRLGRSLSTAIGSGGPTLKIQTSNGGISITRK